MNKKYYVIVGFLTICLIAAFFVGTTTSQEPLEYNPWYDLTQDGAINIFDLRRLAKHYDLTGEPINTTGLLLDLNTTVACMHSGNISVPAAAFEPRNRTDQLYGYNYIENHEDYGFASMAPVQLPDGATVTNFTTYWYDNGAATIQCYLTSYNNTYAYRDLAAAHSTGSTGAGSSHTSVIWEGREIVDNGEYAYIIELYIPYSSSHQDYRFYYAVIEWEYLP